MEKRKETTCFKNVTTEFEKMRAEIVKCRQYKQITDEFFIHAYALAKEIQQKYDYKITGVDEIKKIFDSLGITLHEEKYCTELTNHTISDSCTIRLSLEEKITINIKYAVDDSQEHLILYHGDNRVFIYFYALVIMVMFYDSLKDKGSMTFYCENSEYNINEEIATIVAIFLLYIKYDYRYRVKKYYHTCLRNGKIVRELADIHPHFNIPMSYKYSGSAEYTLEHLKVSTVIKMIAQVHTLSTKFEEEYKVLSKMLAPEELYLTYKNRNLTF